MECQINKNLSLLNTCRLCLDKEGVAVIFDLHDLTFNIYSCMGIKIVEKDSRNYPNKICKKCFEIIVNFVDLKSKAIKYDTYLKTLFNDNNVKEENKVDSTNNIEDGPDFTISNLTENSEVTFLTVRKDLYESSSPSMEENMTQQSEPCISNKPEELKCTICSKKFKTRKQYSLHQRSHNKLFTCPIDICSKKFATKGDLEKHIRAHTGERPYQCDECNKSFTQKVSLKAHKMSIHSLAT